MSIEANRKFTFKGVNHIALVCRDMAETVHFYRDILGMPLIKAFDLPRNMGQHFFFDCGNGDAIAFFWFSGAPERQPGINVPLDMPTRGPFVTAHGSMNHLALNVDPDHFEECHRRLIAAGIDVTPILNHDHSETQVTDDMTDDVYVRSIYFRDPDGILLEIATWTRQPDGGPDDILTEPFTADTVLAG
jgi:catechol 2,3-dioxygenase-like lactoylglutathione lyase family enzyme